MAQKQAKKTGVGGYFVSFLILCLVVAGGIWVARANNIQNATDVWKYFSKKSSQFDQCLPDDMINNPTALNCTIDPQNGGVVANGDTNSTTGGQQGENQAPADQGSGGEFISQEPGVYWGVNGGNTGGLSLDKTHVNIDEVKAKLESLGSSKTAENSDGFSRSEFRYWAGSPCNTRESLMRDAGIDVTLGDRCQPLSGTWVSPYDKKELSVEDNIRIDHIIPLEYIYQHGGSTWDEQKKTDIANDKDNLVIVSSDSFNNKNYQSFSQWTPENKEAQCDYAVSWVNVAHKYGVSIDNNDKDAIKQVLDSCK